MNFVRQMEEKLSVWPFPKRKSSLINNDFRLGDQFLKYRRSLHFEPLRNLWLKNSDTLSECVVSYLSSESVQKKERDAARERKEL